METLKQQSEKYAREASLPLTDAAIIGLVEATNGYFHHSPLTLSDFNISFYDERTDKYFSIKKGSSTVDVIYTLAKVIYRVRK